MEEIKYKIESGNNAMKASAIFRLQELATERFASSHKELPVKPSNVLENQYPELWLIWKEVKSKNQLVSSLCCDVIVHLVEMGFVDGGSVLASMLVSASQISCPGGLVRTTSHLLKFVNTSAPFGISANQHPFVSLLRASPNSLWPLILHEIQLVVEANPRDVGNLTPVFMFGLCNPHEMDHLASFRHALAKILLKYQDIEEIRGLIKKVFEWQMYDSPISFTESSAIIMDHTQSKALEASDVLLLFSLTLRASRLGLNPRLFLHYLGHQTFQTLDDYSANVLCAMIGKYLNETPYDCLRLVAELAIKVIKDFKIDPRVVGLILIPVIEMVILPTAAREDTKSICNKLIEAGAAKLFCSEKSYPHCNATEEKHEWDTIISDSKISVDLLLEFAQSPSKAISWLSRLSTSEFSDNCKTVYSEVCSLLLTTRDQRLLALALSQILRITKTNAHLCSNALSVVFFKMANLSSADYHSSTPENIFSLMSALPRFSNDKCCVGQILNLITKLNTRSGSLPLLYNLWLIEERSFTHLLKALEQPGNSLTKAKVVKSICEKTPGKHGLDLLRLLSQLLNDFESSSDVTVCTLALEGISILCKEEIIDLKTTVSFISEKITSDHRPEVTKAYCSLLAIGPTLKLMTEDHMNFINESLKFLWTKTKVDNHPMVRASAFEAMKSYSLDHQNLKILPGNLKNHIKLPFSLLANLPEPTTQAPEDVLDYVPGSCWSMLLSCVVEEDVDHVVSFLKSLVKQEVEEKLPRSLYGRTIDGAQKEEPLSYNHLHDKSVLKSLLNYFQLSREEIGDGYDRRSKVLEILHQDLSRPYPPFDWSIIKVKSKDMLVFSQILAKQATFSRSACLLTEGLLRKPESYEIVANLSKKLNYLVEVLPGDLLSSALSDTLYYLSNTYYSDPSSEDLLESILTSLGDFLKDTKISDESKDPICKVLEDFYVSFEESEGILFEILLDNVTEMPLSNLERLSNPKNFEMVNDFVMARSINVRSFMAESGKSDTPLFWFNDCIEVIYNQLNSCCSATISLLFLKFATAISRCRVKNPNSCYTWLLELMGMVRSELRGKPNQPDDKFDTNKIGFLFDIFLIAIAYISEVDAVIADPSKSILVYENKKIRSATLKTSIAKLLKKDTNKVSPWKRFGAPLAEWLLHLQATFENRGMTLEADAIFRSLSSFKVDEQYPEATMWGRLVLRV